MPEESCHHGRHPISTRGGPLPRARVASAIHIPPPACASPSGFGPAAAEQPTPNTNVARICYVVWMIALLVPISLCIMTINTFRRDFSLREFNRLSRDRRPPAPIRHPRSGSLISPQSSRLSARSRVPSRSVSPRRPASSADPSFSWSLLLLNSARVSIRASMPPLTPDTARPSTAPSHTQSREAHA